MLIETPGQSERPPTAGSFLIVTPEARSVRRFRAPLIAELQRRGFQVHVACAPSTPAVESEMATMGVRYHPIPLSRTSVDPRDDLAFMRAMHRLLSKLRPSNVLLCTIKPVVWGGNVARWHPAIRLHAMHTGVGHLFVSTSRRARVLRRVVAPWLRHALRRVDTVTFHNVDDLTLFVRLGLVDPGKCGVVPGSGVDVDEFEPAPMPGGPPTFLMLSRIRREKGICEFLDAARILARSYPYARFAVAGEFDLLGDQEVARRVKEAHARGEVEYRGALSDVRPEIASSHVLVQPSHREGFPRAVVEAMAMGRPAIVCDVPGSRDTIDAQCGVLVPAQDAIALARGMETMLRRRDEWERMGAAAHARARALFRAAPINQKLVDQLVS